MAVSSQVLFLFLCNHLVEREKKEVSDLHDMLGVHGWSSKNPWSSVLFFVYCTSSGNSLLVFCFGHDEAAMCVDGVLKPALVCIFVQALLPFHLCMSLSN